MAGRYLQRSVLSLYTAVPIADLDIVAGLHGKPALAGQSDGIAFNLSNTEGFAAFAISRDAKALGIDVEALTTAIEPETSSLFCSAAESEMLSVLRGPARQSRLLSYWTLKESYLKAMGTGLIAAPEQLNVRLDRETNAIRMDNACRAAMTPCGITAFFSHLAAISLLFQYSRRERNCSFVSVNCHPVDASIIDRHVLTQSVVSA